MSAYNTQLHPCEVLDYNCALSVGVSWIIWNTQAIKLQMYKKVLKLFYLAFSNV